MSRRGFGRTCRDEPEHPGKVLSVRNPIVSHHYLCNPVLRYGHRRESSRRGNMARRPQDREVLVAFGAHLRHVREKAKLTQAALADRARVKAATISLFEGGSLAPSLTTLTILARALRVQPSDLMHPLTEIHPTPQNAVENEILGLLRQLPDDDRDRVVDLARRLGR